MTTTLAIDGMRSVHCVRAVFTALAAVEGIAHADVQLGRAVIEHDGRATCPALGAAIAIAGYSVRECREQRRTLPTL